MSEIRFDSIEPIEEAVYLGPTRYTLREISGDGKVRMDNARLACYEYQDGKLVRVSNLADLEPLLVSLCLFDTELNPVPEAIVRSWPARVQRTLYDRARMISGMTETKDALQKQISILQEQIREMDAREESIKN